MNNVVQNNAASVEAAPSREDFLHEADAVFFNAYVEDFRRALIKSLSRWSLPYDIEAVMEKLHDPYLCFTWMDEDEADFKAEVEFLADDMEADFKASGVWGAGSKNYYDEIAIYPWTSYRFFDELVESWITNAEIPFENKDVIVEFSGELFIVEDNRLVALEAALAEVYNGGIDDYATTVYKVLSYVDGLEFDYTLERDIAEVIATVVKHAKHGYDWYNWSDELHAAEVKKLYTVIHDGSIVNVKLHEDLPLAYRMALLGL